MHGRRPSSLIAGGVLFLVVFAGLTIAALATAELNVATVAIAIVSLFVCVAVVLALIGAMRNPPE
ncbi:MAG: hypothetical protein R2718_05745 [Solirubrobacterales bacterium]|nr:hypothetical protein [Solirubrobacterales bacterium]